MSYKPKSFAGYDFTGAVISALSSDQPAIPP
jgi:hypothetical protein